MVMCLPNGIVAVVNFSLFRSDKQPPKENEGGFSPLSCARSRSHATPADEPIPPVVLHMCR